MDVIRPWDQTWEIVTLPNTTQQDIFEHYTYMCQALISIYATAHQSFHKNTHVLR